MAHSYDLFDVDVLESVLWSIGNSSKIISEALPGTPLLMSVGESPRSV